MLAYTFPKGYRVDNNFVTVLLFMTLEVLKTINMCFVENKLNNNISTNINF